MQAFLFATLCCLCVASTATATELAVRVRDAKGQPVADAVVTLDAPGMVAPAAAPARRTVDQDDEHFTPYVTAFRPGDSVVFRNSDRTRHHVYSFSEAKSFEQLLSPGDTGKPVKLERAGLVAVGCNIHDHMRAWLVVTRSAQVAITGADGIARFPAVPAGTWRAVTWHPHLKPKQPPLAQDVVVAASEAKKVLGVSLRLLPDPRGTNPHRSQY